MASFPLGSLNMKRPLFAFAVLFLLALAVTQRWGGFSGFSIAGGALLVSVCLPKEKQRLGRQLLLCGALAAVAALGAYSTFRLGLEKWQRLEGEQIVFTGWLEETSPYDSAKATLRGRAVWEGGEGTVCLDFPGMPEESAPGQWVTGTFLVTQVREDGAAPGGISIRVQAEEEPQPVPPPGFHPLASLAALRWRLSQTLWEAHPGEDTAVVLALVFSRRDKIPAGRLAELDYAGLRHLLVVSGLHLSLLTGWLDSLCRRLGLGPRAGGLCCLLGVWFLAGMAGFSTSVLRAGIMTSLYLLGRMVYLRSDGLTALGISGLILGAVTPPVLFTAGWQLTFAATLGLLMGSGTLSSLMENRLTGRFGQPGRGSRWAVEALAASVGAQLGVFPVVAAWFGRVTLWGLVTTLPAIPLATGIILLGGIGAVCLSVPALDLFGGLLLDLARFPARLLLLLAKGVRRLPDLACPALFPWQLALCLALPAGLFLCLGCLSRLSRRQGRPLFWAALALTVLTFGGMRLSLHGGAVVSIGKEGGVVIAAQTGTLVLDAGETAWERRLLSERLLRCGAQGPLVMASSRAAPANGILGWQGDLSPDAIYLSGEEIPLLKNQYPGNFLPLGEESQEVLPGVRLSRPLPGCLQVELKGRKLLKSTAAYDIIRESALPEETDLWISRTGESFSGPGMPKPARMPTGDQNVMIRTVRP